ncbi:hypothetical protein GCM10009660_58770 [Catellatospora bangladeshensis]
MQGQDHGRAPERGGQVGAGVAAGAREQRHRTGHRQPHGGDLVGGGVLQGQDEPARGRPVGQAVAVEGQGGRARWVGGFEDDRAPLETCVQRSP